MISITHVLPAEGMSYDADQLSTPAPRRELRLLCMLVKARNGSIRSLPVHTLQRLQTPWAPVSFKWSLALPEGLSLRETHAQRPTREVLERCARHRQANALRSAMGCNL